MRKYWISLLTLLISVISLGFSLFRIYPFEIVNDTYIGIIATFIGISVTLLVGYQIFNAIEIKKDLENQKKLMQETQELNDKLLQRINLQESETQEGFDILMGITSYQSDSQRCCVEAFWSLHHALISSLNINRTDFGWIFQLMRRYISEITSACFTSSFTEEDGNYYVFISKVKTPLKIVVQEYISNVEKDKEIIQNHKEYGRIKIEYERIIKLYMKRMDDVITNPNKELKPEEIAHILDWQIK